MKPQLSLTGGPTEDEAAAAIAAVLCILEEEAAGALADAPELISGWHSSARLEVQGLAPARLPVKPSWGHIERLRRAGRGGSGITGQ